MLDKIRVFFCGSIIFYATFSNATTTHAEPDIIVSTSRAALPQVPIPTAITVIDRTEIQKSGATNITEVLRNRAGIQLNDLYGDGSRTSVSLRGFGDSANANTLILVDGRRLNNPDIGNPDINSIALQNIERIEITQGSASVLYGDQAVGGVINVITLKPENLTAGFALGGGSYQRHNAQGQYQQRFGNGIGLKLSGDWRESDNYREHNNVEYYNLGTRLDWQTSKSLLYLEVQTVSDEQQTPGALFADELAADRRQSSADFANDYSNTDTDIVNLGLNYQFNPAWSFLGEYTNRDATTDFVLSFRGFAAPAEVPNLQQRELSSLNPRLLGQYALKHGTLTVTIGYDYENSDYHLSSVFGSQDNQQNVNSLYSQVIWPVLANADLTLGARYAKVNNDLTDRPVFAAGVPETADLDDAVTVGSIGLSVNSSKSLRHFIRYAQNYRFAKVDEHTQSAVVPDFFSGLSGEVLQTQTGESIEVGFEWQAEAIRIMMNLYRLNIDDEIIFDPLSFQNINLDKSRRDGAIFEGSYQFNRNWQLGGAYSYLDAEIRSGEFSGNSVPLTARNTLQTYLNIDFADYWHSYLEVNYVDDRVLSGDLANGFAKLSDYTVVNVQLDYTRAGWQAALRINNLLEREYSDYASTAFDPRSFTIAPAYYPSPERNFWFTVAYRWE